MKKHIHNLGIEVLNKVGAEIKHEIHDVGSKVEATLKVTNDIYDKIHNLVEDYLKKNNLKLIYIQLGGGYVIKKGKEFGTATFTVHKNEIIYGGRKH